MERSGRGVGIGGAARRRRLPARVAVLAAMLASTVAAGATNADPVLVGAGDIADCSSTGDERTATIIDGIAGDVFTAGDNVYPKSTAANYASCYGPSWGRFKPKTIPVIGNHEYGTRNEALEAAGLSE